MHGFVDFVGGDAVRGTESEVFLKGLAINAVGMSSKFVQQLLSFATLARIWWKEASHLHPSWFSLIVSSL